MGNSEKGLHLTTRLPIGSIPGCKCQDQRLDLDNFGASMQPNFLSPTNSTSTFLVLASSPPRGLN